MGGRTDRNVVVGALSCALAFVLFAAPGCFLVEDLSKDQGVVTPSGEDGAEIRFSEDRDVVWSAAYSVADEWGVIILSDPEHSVLEAREGDTTVSADVTQLNSGVIRVRFRARRLGSTVPDRERAEILAENLARRLARS